MKKKSHLYGVLLAAGCCTLALASSGTGLSIVFTPDHASGSANVQAANADPVKRLPAKLSLAPDQLGRMLKRMPTRQRVSTLDAESGTSTVQYETKLLVTINDVAGDSTTAVIDVTHEADGTATFKLPNFILGSDDDKMPVGNITLRNVQVEQKDGYEVLTTNQSIEIEAGDDPNVNEDEWMGPSLGEVPIAMTGKVTPDKLYASIDIKMEELNQVIHVGVGQDIGFDEVDPGNPGDKGDTPEVNPGQDNKFTQTLWDSDVDNASMQSFTEGCTINEGSICFNGGSAKNFFVAPVSDESYIGWKSRAGFTYDYSGTISADKPTTVTACIIYSPTNDYTQLYVLRSKKVALDSTNHYTGDFNLSATLLRSDIPLLVAFVTEEDTTGATPAIQVSHNKMTVSCPIFGTVKPWDSENSLPGLGLSNDLDGEKYTMACSDSLTTLGLLYQNNEVLITGINTTAAEFTVPAFVTIDGEARQLCFGKHDYSFDWSAASSLKKLDITQAEPMNVDFSESSVTDIYYNLDIPFYGFTGVENIYLHLPFTATRNDYSSNGFKRVLLGVEQPNFPQPYDSSFFVVPGENENDFFSIAIYDGRFQLAEIITDKDTITLPSILPYTSSTGSHYAVSLLGADNRYTSGLLCRKAFKLKSVIVPEFYDECYVNWDRSTLLNELHLRGNKPSTYWNLSSRMTVYAPTQSIYDDLTTDSQWNNATIVPEGWDFEWMTVDVKRKGEFAQTYIEMTEADWALARNVKVTGTLNESDLQNLKKMTNLMKLDLSEAQFTTLPSNFMESQSKLAEVTLPANVRAIPNYAFKYCRGLKKVTAPGVKKVDYGAFYNCSQLTDFDISQVTYIGSNAFNSCTLFNPPALCEGLTTLGSSAFYNCGITQVTVPEGIKQLENSVFSSCENLTKVTLPTHLTEIGSSAFSQCKNLPEIQLPESLISIESSAFNSCKKLKELTIPSNVQSVGGSFISYCDSLLTVKCKAVVPPNTSGSFTDGLDLNHCVLYVAPFAIDAYRAANNWKNFLIIKALEEPVKNIYINRPMTFDLQSQDDAVLQDNPNMTLSCKNSDGNYNTSNVGQLTANGDGTLSAGVFDIQHKMANRDNSYYNSDYRTSLVNNAEHMRADSVVCRIEFEKNAWHFISFQYDVKMADIQPLYGTDFVIRQYDSAKRAGAKVSTKGMGGGGSSSEQTESNWVDVPADGTLLAGKGYIIQVANNTTDSLNNTNPAVVVFPSRNTLTKNKLFASTNVVVPLEEYPAEFAHNRSWNLVGNPYPCYYDLHYLMDDFTTPIVLWRGSSYQAYSPVDDNLILRPNEAFFVQRPLDQEQMAFATEGRMHYTDARNSNASPGAKAPAADRSAAGRSVFNFLVAGNGADDRARIVMNEQASAAYDTRTDASKFFAEKATGIELYVNADTRYDICERPMGNGTATLGMRVGKAGTYTLSLNGRNTEGWTVMLTDTQTGRTVKLNERDYEFEAAAGEQPQRFQLAFTSAPATGLEGVSVSDPDAQVRVVNTAGLTVFQGRFADFREQAPTGVYVVIEGSKSYKVVVK